MSKKCRAYSKSKLGLEQSDNKRAFYAGWEAAIAEAEKGPVKVTLEDFLKAVGQVARNHPTNEDAEMIDKKQPAWVCSECGNKHKAGKWFLVSTWHLGECGVCKQKKPVTEPRDCGYFKKGWNK